MILSEEAERSLLDSLSRAKALELAPVSVYVLVLMIAGLAGNICVCIFYNQRHRVTPTTRLIVAVAIIDTVICVLMPKNVADISLSYKFTSSALCKLNNFVNHTTAISSAMVLVAVAAFRFRAVCRPFASQFSIRHANIAIAISVTFSFVASVPVLVTHESVAINVTVNSTLQITGYDCNTSKKPSMKPLNLFVNVLHFFIFISTTMSFVILYGKMGHSILRYYQRKKSLSESAASTSVKSTSDFTTDMESEIPAKSGTGHGRADMADSSDSGVEEIGVDSGTEMVDSPGAEQGRHTQLSGTAGTDVGEIDISLKKMDQDKDKQSHENADMDSGRKELHTDTKHAMVTFDKHCITSEEHVKPKRIDSDQKENARFSSVAVKQTAMLFIITLIFILSFLPYLVMNISRSLSKNKDGDDDFTNWIQFCTRSYLINSATNPFVYSLFNTEFRAFVKKTFCRCCTK